MSTIQPNNSCRDPFNDILDAVVSGDASTCDQTILNDTLRADPEARRAYIHAMAFEAMLAREFAPLEASQAPASARRSRWLTPTAIAATIMLAATLAWFLQPHQVAPPKAADYLIDYDQDITHAVITSLDDAGGRCGKSPLIHGLRLTYGLLELDHGLMEITLDSGVELTLEGPARLQLESANRARLDVGRASAEVPEQARGFVLHTPSSYIRDLGTAFAVEVRNARETDLYVLKGDVEVAATGRNAVIPPHILHQSEGVRLAGGYMVPISFHADHPGQKRRKHTTKIPPSVHWSFDSWDGSTTTDSTRSHLLTIQRNANQAAAPQILDGPFGLALHFDGQGSFARSDYPGVGGSQPRTIACWIRLQPENSTEPRQSNGIITWGVNRSRGNWQVVWNNAQSQGNPGAPRVEFGKGYVIGSTDLRDGRWHHLAVVFLGGPKANVASHVKIYVDGRLEALSGRRQRRIDTDITSTAAHPLTLGRFIGAGAGRKAGFLEGDLDELHVFEGALLPGQITRLMKRNQIALPE